MHGATINTKCSQLRNALHDGFISVADGHMINTNCSSSHNR